MLLNSVANLMSYNIISKLGYTEREHSAPPNVFTACSTASLTCFSSLISTIQGKALPPAA